MARHYDGTRRDRKREKDRERLKWKKIGADEIISYPGYTIALKRCDLGCGGMMSWCTCCEVFSNNCCVDYGTCMCS
ncbi:hypothetical protein [Acinetobacter sp.]|uniref:hypothetical protein n=1 Tax=Acinetobacter sp. TaxID=472 RepID=UPI003753C0EA